MSREPRPEPSSLNDSREPDRQLIARTLRGDADAYDALVTRYRDRLYALVYHMVLNAQEAEDLAQETFVKAYRSLGKFRQESNFYTWLYRIAVNLVYTQSKKSSRRRTLFTAALEAGEPMGVHWPSTPEELAQSEETKEMILKAIHQLDPRFRQVLILKELEGLEVAEVARILSLPEGTVKSRLYRAREDLRRLLKSWRREP
ncbi:MAG: sigma-70 family RNA polymerase sigma factor [candidate division FCPU426 bacterium]